MRDRASAKDETVWLFRGTMQEKRGLLALFCDPFSPSSFVAGRAADPVTQPWPDLRRDKEECSIEGDSVFIRV